MGTSTEVLFGLSVISLFVLLWRCKIWCRHLAEKVTDKKIFTILRFAYLCQTFLVACFSVLMSLIVCRLNSIGLDGATKILLAISGIVASAIFPPFGAIVAHLSFIGRIETKSFYRHLATIELLLVAPFTIGLMGLSIWYLCS